MKPKIVQFKDGGFAIRRRAWPAFWYEYLGADTSEDYWWVSLHHVRNHATFATAESAAARLDQLRKPDYGTPIDLLRSNP